MNKAQEIARLRSLVKELGDDSYTGPWLREQLPIIEAEITADLPAGTHAFTLAQARAEASRILTEAREGADAIKRLVEEQADRTRKAAQDYSTQLMENARRALRTLALTDRMPHMPGMSLTPDELWDAQTEDFECIALRARAAGFTCTDNTTKPTPTP